MTTRLAAALTGCFLLATTLSADLVTIPNSVKYRDTSLPNAKGRSGSASIEARALLGKDGATELSITTGSFDADTAASGSIDKVQLRGASGATRNFTNRTGAVFTETLTGLGRHQLLEVQANVRGIDGARTDVVSATETVKLRPDLLVDRITVAPHAAAGVPLRIFAILRERNGDVGARADCVLRANGAEVDRANGIWVDANGSVTCELTHTFDAAGVQQLEVAATGVAPGDWDLANNAATASVHVYDSVTSLPDWWASASDEVSHVAYRSTTPTGENENTNYSNTTIVASDALIRNVTKAQWSALKVSYQEAHDGTTTVDVPDAPFGRPARDCSMAKLGSVEIEKCWVAPRRGEPFDPVIRVSTWHGGGDVTYYSHGWFSTDDPTTGESDRYTYNDSSEYHFGPRFHIGNSVALRMQASDGTNLYETSPFLNTAPSEYIQDDPYTCFDGWDGQYCYEWHEHTVSRSGFASSGAF